MFDTIREVTSYDIVAQAILERRKRLMSDFDKIKDYIINEIIKNPNIMFNDYIRGDDDFCNIDLVGVIVGLFEMLHVIVKNEDYDYMFHWANKIGSWVDTYYFRDLIKEYYDGK